MLSIFAHFEIRTQTLTVHCHRQKHGMGIMSLLEDYCKYVKEPIFSPTLGKTRQKSTLDLWKVLEMFWGREQKEKLQELVFGNSGITLPASKTLMNSLYNMLTLSADIHIYWALRIFKQMQKLDIRIGRLLKGLRLW